MQLEVEVLQSGKCRRNFCDGRRKDFAWLGSDGDSLERTVLLRGKDTRILLLQWVMGSSKTRQNTAPPNQTLLKLHDSTFTALAS